MRCALLLGALGALLVTGCDLDNVEWAFVSNPSGDGGTGGGAVIVIRASSSSSASLPAAVGFVTANGRDQRGAATVRLLVGGDVALIERPTSLELRSPVLPSIRTELAGARLSTASTGPFAAEIMVPEASRIDPLAVGAGRLRIAAHGTLLVLEHEVGVSAFGSGDPVRAPVGTSVRTAGDEIGLLFADGRFTRLLAVPPAAMDAQLRTPGTDRVELLGPHGEVLARIPAAPVTLHHGAGGLLLTASFPDGVGADRTPMALTIAAWNRHLLRVE
jgi:hypothetical protein